VGEAARDGLAYVVQNVLRTALQITECLLRDNQREFVLLESGFAA